MVRRIILISGPISSGKTTLSRGLADRFKMLPIKTRDLLVERLGEGRPTQRKDLQAEGDRLDRRTSGQWVLEELNRRLRQTDEDATVLVDAVRILAQIDAIREAYGSIVTHIHLTAPQEVLAKRYNETKSDTLGYEEVSRNRTERRIDMLQDPADVVIDTNRCNEEDVLVRAACHLGLYGKESSGFVDVIVGGQYGSEGKGQIAHYLAREYDLLVRVGGPNAGHKVYETPEPYTHHHLPSGTRKSDARLLIGAGAVIRVPSLLNEIADCNIDVDRLRIDRNAMIISDQDIDHEGSLVQTIGSTGQGVGSATARRIMGRSEPAQLAQDIPDLRPYLCNGLDVLNDYFYQNGRVCLEGTQRTGLSLYHGGYPRVTSRDTTVSGCLAEAGIPPSRVRRVVMVCRSYPIRVQDPPGGTSGFMSQPISLEEISKRSGIELQTLQQTETTSTTHRPRRIAEFDWNLLRKSTLLNGPTDLALTFTDYLSAKNSSARRFEQLHPDTINFIQEVERVSGARVSLIATGFNPRSIIDRRSW